MPPEEPQAAESTAWAGESGRPREMILLAIASILATFPVWLAHYPPMVDIPQHAAQVAILRNLHDPGFRFADLFQFNWFTPYLLGPLAVYPFISLLGIVAACKVVVSASLAGMPFCTALLLKEAGADCYWALLTIPAMYGFVYEWGFLSFLFAAPIGLLFLWVVMRTARRPSAAMFVALGIMTVLLFFCHALTCAFFGIIACVYLLVAAGGLKRAILAMMPMTIVLPIALIWYRRANSLSTTQEPVFWDLGWLHSAGSASMDGRITGFFPRLLGQGVNPLCIVFGISLFVLPFLAGARPSKSVARWVPFAVCVVVLLICPSNIFGSFFIYQRFTVFALPLFLIGLERAPADFRVWRVVGVILLTAWLGVVANRTLRYEHDAKDFTEVLTHMEPNQRALSLVFEWQLDSMPVPVFRHYPAWYSAIKKGVVDMSFAMCYPQIVVYKPSKMPALPIDFELHPQTFTWASTDAGIYRYFVVRAPVDIGPRLFFDAPCRIRLAAQKGSWWLYERDSRCTALGAP